MHACGGRECDKAWGEGMWKVIQGGEQMSTFCLVITSAYCSRFFLLQRKESAHVFMFFSLKYTHRLRNTPTGEEQGGEGGHLFLPHDMGRQLVGEGS